ncbi:MAG: hypothetical protein JWR63_2270, partial [Conexibacter sp.]|nr:hypothetical protein [Conexibacter sp.]
LDAWLAARRDGPVARCPDPGTPASTHEDDGITETPLRFRL